jgi:hypothetical protein
VAVLDAATADAACACFAKSGETVVRLGEVVAASGSERVNFRGHLDLSFKAA